LDKFYIITNHQKDEGLALTKTIRDYLLANGKECIIQEKCLEQHNTDYMFTDAKTIPDNVNCIMVLGGDGTLIQAARDVAVKHIPLLGINLETNNILPALDKLIHDNYIIEERLMLRGEVFRNEESVFKNRALNDIVINREGKLRIIDYDIYVNGEYLVSYSADGIIISTPTGSTGYNLSAGGPIVDPKAEILTVTPICPHTLNSKSIVLSANDKVVIKIGPGRKMDVEAVTATYDGDTNVKMETSDCIEITRSSKSTQIIKLSNISFLEALRNKMGDCR
jgi:NAD+ kinase